MPADDPIITPGLPLSGDVSKVTFTGPVSLTTWPVNPLSRQNGVGYTPSNFISDPCGMCCVS